VEAKRDVLPEPEYTSGQDEKKSGRKAGKEVVRIPQKKENHSGNRLYNTESKTGLRAFMIIQKKRSEKWQGSIRGKAILKGSNHTATRERLPEVKKVEE